MQIDRGYLYPYMATDQEKSETSYDDPYNLITDRTISAVKELVPILEAVSPEGKPLLIIFMCNHCPYVKVKFETIKKLQSDFPQRNIVGINSNESINYPEDSFDNMVKVAKEKNFNFTYLHDETQEVAKEYGAVCTPDPYLFDSDLKLVYHGRIDNALSPDATPTKHDMHEAVEALLKGEKVEKEFLPSQGCSIKWKEDMD